MVVTSLGGRDCSRHWRSARSSGPVPRPTRVHHLSVARRRAVAVRASLGPASYGPRWARAAGAGSRAEVGARAASSLAVRRGVEPTVVTRPGRDCRSVHRLADRAELLASWRNRRASRDTWGRSQRGAGGGWDILWPVGELVRAVADLPLCA